MSGPFSDVTETIFTQKDVLSESYQPEEILERDEEITEYRYALEDILFGREPENIMIYGKAGLGKTAVTTYMMDALLDEVQQREQADELYVHELNCNGKTLFVVVRRLVNELLPPTASAFPKRGLGTGDAFEELYRQLDRIGGIHIIVFDEIDHLDDANTLLYELPRARANGYISNAYVGIIGISNNYTFRQSLSPKVKDSLMETEISFSPYDAHELQTILRDRADRAFVEGGYDDSAIELASAIAASDMGNARQAIDLLRIGAEEAKKAGDTCVTDRHIGEARSFAQRGRLSNRIRDQTRQSQLILEAIAQLEQCNQTPARTKTIQQRYRTVAEIWEVEPLTSLKSVQKHLSDLEMLGFLRKYNRNEGKGGGQYFEYELSLNHEIVLDTREEIRAE